MIEQLGKRGQNNSENRSRTAIEGLQNTIETLFSQVTCSIPDIPLPSMRRARDLVLAGLLTGIPTALAKEPAHTESAVTTEDETVEESIDRLVTAFTDPQLMNQEMDNRGGIESVSSERLRLAQEVIATFPLKDVLLTLSEISGVAPEVLVKENRLEMFGLYSPESLDKLYAKQRAELEADQDTATLANMDKMLRLLKNNSGMYVNSIDAMYINVGQIDDRHPLSDEDFQATVYQTIVHEWFHAFETGSDGIATEEYTPNDDVIIEGLTDKLTEIFLKKYPRYNAEKKRESNGYRFTAQPIADAMLVLSGEQAVMADYVRGDYDHIGELVDAAVGQETWQKMRTVELPLPKGSEDARSLAPLLVLMSHLGIERSEQLLRTVNATESYRTLISVRRENTHGILVRNENVLPNLQDVRNGLIINLGQKGKDTLISLTGIDEMMPTPSQPVGPTAIDQRWSHTQWALPLETWSYSDDRLVDFVVRGIDSTLH